VAVDNCIFTVREGRLQVLLIRMKKPPFGGKWALPGGLIEHGERLEGAAARILQEQTGVSRVYLEQLYTFDELDRDPGGRVISVAYFSLVGPSGHQLRTTSKYSDVRWWQPRDVGRLAYDHNEILAYAQQRLAWKVQYTNVVWSLLPGRFTLSELQRTYEAVLERRLDKRNFRKKILASGLILSVGEQARTGAHRPAMLYRFGARTPKLVELL
jgi:8-oxo-dGTP diphosphatase